LKPGQWGSPLVQEDKLGKKSYDDDNNNNTTTTTTKQQPPPPIDFFIE
jgi:hypothetical protein